MMINIASAISHMAISIMTFTNKKETFTHMMVASCCFHAFPKFKFPSVCHVWAKKPISSSPILSSSMAAAAAAPVKLTRASGKRNGNCPLYMQNLKTTKDLNLKSWSCFLHPNPEWPLLDCVHGRGHCGHEPCHETGRAPGQDQCHQAVNSTNSKYLISKKQ